MIDKMIPKHGERKNQRLIQDQITSLCKSTTTVCDIYCEKCAEWINTQNHDFLDVSINCPKCKTRW